MYRLHTFIFLLCFASPNLSSAQADFTSCHPEMEGVEVDLEGASAPLLEQRVHDLFTKDQAARSTDEIDWETVSKKDEARRAEVLGYLVEGKIMSARALVDASFIFQHGDCPAHYQLANKLADKAVQLGSVDAKWIYAATLDRYLLSVGEKQKFGTQYTSSDGCTYTLESYDPTTTDEERAEYDVPPLAAALAQAETFGECDFGKMRANRLLGFECVKIVIQ